MPDIASVLSDGKQEKLEMVAEKLRKKEMELKTKSTALEKSLHASETTCSRLMEENVELKSDIEELEREIMEVCQISKRIGCHLMNKESNQFFYMLLD